MSVQGLEPAIHRAVKDDVPRRNQGSAPRGKSLFHAPDFLCRHRVPRANHAAMSSRPWIHTYIGADERSACDVIRLDPLKFHAEMVMRYVNQAGARRVRRRLPVFSTGRRGADIADGLKTR